MTIITVTLVRAKVNLLYHLADFFLENNKDFVENLNIMFMYDKIIHRKS